MWLYCQSREAARSTQQGAEQRSVNTTDSSHLEEGSPQKMYIQVSIRCILNISDVTSIVLHTCAPVPAVHFITDEDQLFGLYFSSCLRRGDDKNIQNTTEQIHIYLGVPSFRQLNYVLWLKYAGGY